MDSGREQRAARLVRRVLILADESADWKVAGLRQLDRLVFALQDFIRPSGQPLRVDVFWKPEIAPERQWLPQDTRFGSTSVSDCEADTLEEEPFDLIISTRLLLFRNSLQQLLAALPPPAERAVASSGPWESYRSSFENGLAGATDIEGSQPWRYLRNVLDLPRAERAFLRQSGKSQDGLAARYVNRPLSRCITRWLLRLPLTPNTWSILVFSLPLTACLLFLHGTTRMFFVGAVIYQLYSILDGCDGEIARAKFLQTDFGRRLDSLLDLVGNMLLALCLGIGLARQWERGHAGGWLYVMEGIAAAVLIGLSEGIVFARRSRLVTSPPSAKWGAALYQRHHEFLERSGFLVIGENLAWWLIQLTKRDMAMLAFLFLAAAGFADVILHLLLVVSGISAALAGNAFLRQPAPALPQEAS